MKKSFIKQLSIVVATATMVTSLSACGNKTETKNNNSKSGLPLITLEFLGPSNTSTINNWDSVMAKFYEQTKDTLNLKINYTFTTFDNIGQKISLKFAAGDPLDCTFSAPWTNPNISQMVSKGQIANLDKYFTDSKYSGLKKAFNQDYLKNNSFADSTGEYHIYGVPFSHGFTAAGAVYYRKDLADKYGIGDIKSYDDLLKYNDAIKANEKGMIPMSWLGSSDGISGAIQHFIDPVATKHNTATIAGVGLIIKDDGSVYASTNAISPALDPEFQKLQEAPLNTLDPLREYKTARDWYTKGYVEKDILSQKDAEAQFASGKAASFIRSIDTFSEIDGRLANGVPGAKLGYWCQDEAPKSIGTDFRAWNFGVLPVTSKNQDRTMSFFNWLYTDKKNHDLFELGVEGKDWEAVGTDKYKVPTGVDAKSVYNFPGFIMTWNPTMQKYDSKNPDAIVKKMNNYGNTNFYYKTIEAGFTFVPDAVKNEMAKMGDLLSLTRAVQNGVIADIPGKLVDIQKQYDQAGFSKVRAEVLKQYSAWLKVNPYKGE